MSDDGLDDANTDIEDLSSERYTALRKLAGTDFGRFAVELQPVSEQVQLKLIGQLSEFRKLAGDAVGTIARAHEATLKSSDEGDRALREAFNQWRDSLVRLLDAPELSLEERLEITKEIGRTVEIQAEKETQSKSFKAKLLERLTIGAIVAAGLVVVAVVGGKMGVEQSDSGSV